MPSRRSLFHACAGLLVPLTGCSILNEGRMRPKSSFHGDRPVAYTHEDLRLTGPKHPIRIGESVEFTVTNTTKDSIFGCWRNWTIQRLENGEWRELLWAVPDEPQGCSNPLVAGESDTVRLLFTRREIEETSNVTLRGGLQAGQYRFVTLSADPFLAVRFEVTSQ